MKKESSKFVPLANKVNILVYRYVATTCKNANETVITDYVKKQEQDCET